MGLKDIKIPADASDKQTTDAKSAVPPVEFNVSIGAATNVITITDRQGVQDRLPTKSYRTYFLPAAFAPMSIGNTSTVPAPVVQAALARAAGQKVATLVADTAAPGFGTNLTVEDPKNFGKAGFYYCVAVNRSGVEAPPEHIVSTDAFGAARDTSSSGGGGGGGGGGGSAGITSINGDTTAAQIIAAGTGISVSSVGGTTTITNTGGTGWTMEDSSTVVDGTATIFTFSTAVAVGNPIFADGRLMNEAIGDYTRSGSTITLALAPISTVTRFF